MIRKIILFVMLTTVFFGNSTYAYESIEWNENGSIIISGYGKKAGDTVSITITDSNDEMLYVDETVCDENNKYTFKARLKDNRGINIKIGSYLGLTSFLSDGTKKAIIYVSPGGDDSNDGSYTHQVKSLNRALELSSDRNADIVIGGTIDAEEIIFNKEQKINIRGGTIDISKFDTFNVDANISLENVKLVTKSNQTLNIVGKVEFGKNVSVTEPINIVGTECYIKSGNFNCVSTDKLYIAENVSVKEIFDCMNIAFLNDVDMSEKIKGEYNKIIKCSSGGSIEFHNNGINVLPEDGRACKVDDGKYCVDNYIDIENGIHSIEYAYDFKLGKLIIDEDAGKVNISVIANNLNEDIERQSPVLVMAVYDNNNTLLKSEAKKYQDVGRYEEIFDFDSHGEGYVKVFIWDSFGRMTPLADFSYADAGVKSDITEFYVSTDGNDSNPGTYSLPFETIDAARLACQNVDGKKVVYVRGGKYNISSSIQFDGHDNNTLYKPFDGEKVIFTTAEYLNGSDFGENSDGKDRIIDSVAKEKVLCADVSDWEDLGEILDFDHGSVYSPEPTVTINGTRGVLAQYPNEGYVNIGSVIDSGEREDGNKGTFSFVAKNINWTRLAQWNNASDIVLRGYLSQDWAYAAYNGSMKTGVFYSENPYIYSKPTANQRIKFTNLLEEVDVPGEWYLDRENKKLWLYPTDDWSSESKVSFTTGTDIDTIFMFNESSDGITIEGFNFENIGADVVRINSGKNIEVKNCLFKNILGRAFYTENAENCKFDNNSVNETSGEAVSINGGISRTLTSGNNIVSNNKIEKFAIDNKTYNPAIRISGVGNKASHNEISDSAHMAISFAGQYHVMEYNKISNVCTETSDCGAIYSGRNWTYRGNVIKRNYFSHILKNVGTSYVHAVYLDDCMSSANIYENVFYDVNSAVFIGGGRDNNVKNNVMIDCERTVCVDSRATDEKYLNHVLTSLNNASYYRSELWKKKFPTLYNILDDEPMYPKYNVISENVFCNSPKPIFTGVAEKYVTVGNNIVTDNIEMFDGYDTENFMIKENANVFESIPEFKNISFYEIGIK